MRNYSVMDESKGFSNFALLYLYNALRCTLTQDAFESHEDEKYRKEISLVRHNLLRLRRNRADRNLWLFFEFDLLDLLVSATGEIEANLRNYDVGLLEMYNELRLSDFTFNRVANLELDICANHVFSVEEISLHLTVVPFLLEEADVTAQLYTREMRQALWKTLNFFNFCMLQINEHDMNIANMYQKEINVFLKVADKFDFISVNEENVMELHDEIHLKNKYGKKLLRNFFIFLKMFLFYQVVDEFEYFHYIEVVPIYIRTKKGTMKSRSYNMESVFYPLVEGVYKQDLKINEGILLIRILKQYSIESHTKLGYYYDSDFIYKAIIYESVLTSSSEPSSAQPGVKFEPLYSQNMDVTKRALPADEDLTLSLILLANTDTHVDVLLEQIHNFVFPKDIFLANRDSNRERIKILGSCIYTKESQPPIFQGFFSRGLSTYILFKILDLLKPDKKLLYLSIDKAEDAKNQIASEKIAERIMNVTQQLYEVLLLFERDAIINFDKLEHSDECDVCLLGYRGLYTLYVCIFIPILLSILVCYCIYRKKMGAQGSSAVRKIAVCPSQVKSIEPNIVPLQL
ncbi:hypothetical protein, conserved [Plasmodium vivax]|uniref:Uncharacterized protein n=1 Tax=Plasmodium vivax (strain Salvador I) TaxID=126793 RepID=A5KDX8_PLAVS|nr:hypothetical protein, conserved [Plasmodium vivax]EDL42427.1 hypothetical protein, conserved [Plasmodium vivax]|eukprot:XP_001608451.1 hypothetical protein [Plasmodium vivax Sal-1]